MSYLGVKSEQGTLIYRMPGTRGSQNGARQNEKAPTAETWSGQTGDLPRSSRRCGTLRFKRRFNQRRAVHQA